MNARMLTLGLCVRATTRNAGKQQCRPELHPRDGRWKGDTMKIHMDMDLTPEEARTLFGLPDVKPMQQAMMGEIETRM